MRLERKIQSQNGLVELDVSDLLKIVLHVYLVPCPRFSNGLKMLTHSVSAISQETPTELALYGSVH